MDSDRAKIANRMLTLEEVRRLNRPAVFHAFGDHLVYVDGGIFSVPAEAPPSEPEDVPGLPGTYEIHEEVGIEYGWRHRVGCDCHFCLMAA